MQQALDFGDFLRCAAYLPDTVVAGIARNGYIALYACLFQQLLRGIVLDVEVGVAVEQGAERGAVPAEERLLGAEDGGDDVRRYLAAFQLEEVVCPELIFDENGDGRLRQVEELAHAAAGVERQVADHVRQRVVFPHLVSRRGEEGEENLALRVLRLYLLDEGATLFKLAQRCRVEPDATLAGEVRPAKELGSLPLSLAHKPSFCVEQ